MDELKNRGLETEEIILQDDSTIKIHGKFLHLDNETKDIDFWNLINTVFQYFNLCENLNKFQTKTEYVVQIPVAFQRALDEGSMQFMNAKNGDLRAKLMRRTENGQLRIAADLTIKPENRMVGNPFQDVAENVYQLYMEQLMHDLMQRVEDTYQTVKKIELVQKEDRIGQVESGREQLLLALNQTDDVLKKMGIQNAIQTLSVVRNQIKETIEQRVKTFTPVPKWGFRQIIKAVKNGNYFREKDEEYDEIQQWFYLYLQATKLMAVANAYIGAYENIEVLYDLTRDFVEKLDFTNLKTFQYLPKKDKDHFEGIYDFASDYVKVERDKCLDLVRNYDYLIIDISDEEMLRLFLNER